MTFTCRPCGERSRHRISKQGYHYGSVLVHCPGCNNRHIISDHLQIFGDRRVTVEEILRERGQLVRKGTLGEDGDIEFWEDGTVTTRDNDEVAEVTSPMEADDSLPGASFSKLPRLQGQEPSRS